LRERNETPISGLPEIGTHYAWRHHCRGLFQMPIAA